ncbi:type II secretion system minor pseudopilin GspJ [soil metagenome]
MGKMPMLRNAFTLIELVVALSIVAVMAVSLYASVRIAFKAQSSAEAAIEPSRTAELAMEFLRQDIENAMPPATTGGGIALATGKLAGDFVGTDGTDDRGHPGDDLNFYSTAEAGEHVSGNGEIKNIELLITTTTNSTDHVLTRRVTRNLLSAVVPTPDEEILCRGVSGFNLRYYNGTDWQDTWSASAQDNVLPAAVEVTLELERPAGDTGTRTLRFTRVFALSCAKAPPDDGGGAP